MNYGRVINSVLLGRIINFIDCAIRTMADLNGVDEQNLAAVINPLEAARLAAVNIQQHYIMGKQPSRVKGFHSCDYK